MKRILALLLTFALVFGLAACSSGPKPEDTVKKFFEAMKAFDFETMQSCVDGEFDAEDMLGEEEDLTGLMDYLKENASQISYKIGSSSVNEDTATVDVSVEYTDASEVLGEAFSTYIAAMFTALFGGDMTEEELEQAFTDGLADAIANHETSRAAEDLTLDLKLVGEEWKLTDVSEELANVLLSNFMGAMDSLESMFDDEDFGFDFGESEPIEYPISDVVLLDNDIAAMTVQGGSADEWGNISFDILCENKTDKTLSFRSNFAEVNGWYVGGGLGVDIEPGESDVAELYLWPDDIEAIGLEAPDKIVLPIQIADEEGFWEDEFLVDESFTFYPTGLTEDQIAAPERPTAADETVLADNDAFTMIIVGSETDEMWNSLVLRAYIRNNSDKTLYIDWQEVTVNGKEVDPYFSATLPAGAQTVNHITFGGTDMANAGVDTPEQIEFTMRAMDDDAWDELYSESILYRP